MYNAQVIIDKMNSWLGCKQGDATHKHIIDTYNNHKPLAQGYKVKYTDAWCATTVSAAAIECGYTAIIPTECSCNRMIKLLQGMGIWKENDAYVPQTGDIIFYDWQDSGIGDNTGGSDHVGYVEKVEDGVITVIEGNKNKGVEKRAIKVNGRYIRGFGTPKYDTASVPVTPSVKVVTRGVDLSANQGNVDFKALKASGIDFVILRATLRNGNIDPKFEEYYAQAQDADLPVSVYKYSYARTPAQSFQEAMGVVKMLNGRLCTIWLDMEDSEQLKAVGGKAGITNIINAFMDYCVASEYDVGIYCNLNWYKNYISADLKKKYKFWIARYGKNDGTLNDKYEPDIDYTIWQYTSKGKVNGINGFVDLNIRK